MENQSVGQILKKRRKALELTLEKAAELCGMSARGYRKVEQGESDPKLSSLLRIAAAYEMDLGDLNLCVPILV